MNEDDFEDLISEEDSLPLNLDIVRANIPSYSSEKLCEMIVCDRYFGCYKEIAIICMEELASRRVAGDNYVFEDYIEKAYKELPELNLTIPDLGDILREVIGRKLK